MHTTQADFLIYYTHGGTFQHRARCINSPQLLVYTVSFIRRVYSKLDRINSLWPIAKSLPGSTKYYGNNNNDVVCSVKTYVLDIGGCTMADGWPIKIRTYVLTEICWVYKSQIIFPAPLHGCTVNYQAWSGTYIRLKNIHHFAIVYIVCMYAIWKHCYGR